MATVTNSTTERLAEYVDDVLTGCVVVGRLVRLAVERHQRDLEEGAARGLHFDDEEADTAVGFIELLRHSKGEWAGKPFILEPWEVFIVCSLFGWMRFNPKFRTYLRRYQRAFVSLGRKNGKSILAAAIGHKLFVADGEEGAEVYTVATARQQARIVHEEAKRMVKSSPALRGIVKVLRDNLSIEATNSKYEPLGGDTDAVEGLNVSGAVIDEIHVHRTREIWDTLETATGARRNPLLFAITTAGDSDDTESIYQELKSLSIDILEGGAAGLADDSWFAYIATLDVGDDWADESCWIKANPNLGISVSLDDLRAKCQRAKHSTGAVGPFRRRHCNLDSPSSRLPWVEIDKWDACRVDELSAEQEPDDEVLERLRGRPCYVGGDLSSVKDLTALVFAFPDDDEGVDILPFCWCPRENAVGRQHDNRVPYVTWADQGQIELTEGDSVDYDALRALLRRARDEWGWDIRQIAFDPSNARYLVTKLIEEDGFAGEGQVVEHLQTTGHMNEPIGMAEKLVLDGKLRHGGNEPLRWCVSNILIYQDTGGRRRFDKKKSREKIDLAVAMVMAVYGVRQFVANRSPYEERGFLFI